MTFLFACASARNDGIGQSNRHGSSVSVRGAEGGRASIARGVPLRGNGRARVAGLGALWYLAATLARIALQTRPPPAQSNKNSSGREARPRPTSPFIGGCPCAFALHSAPSPV